MSRMQTRVLKTCGEVYGLVRTCEDAKEQDRILELSSEPTIYSYPPLRTGGR
jgi:hypothetical protein